MCSSSSLIWSSWYVLTSTKVGLLCADGLSMNIREKQSLRTLKMRFGIETVLPPVDEATRMERKGSFGTCLYLEC